MAKSEPLPNCAFSIRVLSVLFIRQRHEWTLSAAVTRRIGAYHRTCLRHILGIRWYHHCSNEEVYSRAGIISAPCPTLSNNGEFDSLIMLRAWTKSYRPGRSSARHLVFLLGLTCPTEHPRLTLVSQVSAFRPL